MEILSINLGRLGKGSVATLCLGMLWISLAPSRVHACSCAHPPSPEDARERAAAVFEGRVLEIAAMEEREVGPSPNRIEVMVVRAFKGADAERLTLKTEGDSALCGYPFEPNKSYLIYADGGAESLHVSLCSRTRPIEQAEEDLAVLGMGYVPANPVAPDTEKKSNGEKANEPEPSTNADETAASQPAQRTRGGCASCSVGASGAGDTPQGQWPWGVLGLVGLVGFRLLRRKSRWPS